MTEVKPYDYTKLDEIVLFKGIDSKDTIKLSREGRYINLIKEKEKDKRYYRFDLKEKKFQRINFYKTVENKITDVKIKNITTWFYNCKIITKDLHFGRLILFAKFNRKFDKYKSPVRFIEQLGDKMITATEQWEALGFKVHEMEDFFGKRLVGRSWDHRKDIYEGETKLRDIGWGHFTYYGGVEIAPSDLSKEVFNYIKKNYTEVSETLLYRLYSEYNEGEYHIEEKLKKIARDPEFFGIFHYKSSRGYYRRNSEREQRWAFGTSHESRTVRQHLMEVITEYNLDPLAFCKWLKKQINVDRNDIGYLLGDGNHYSDYLACEKDLCDGRLSKMNKYPDNFRAQFHRIQEEFNAKQEEIDEAVFERQSIKNKGLEHIGRTFQIVLPKKINDINYEAQCLQHCVRTYIPRIIKGETLILFLRDKKNPDDPLVTLEVKKGALTQAYGKNDSKPKKEHLEFLKMWCNMKNLRIGCWKSDLL